jgi:hypothetical protein
MRETPAIAPLGSANVWLPDSAERDSFEAGFDRPTPQAQLGKQLTDTC